MNMNDVDLQTSLSKNNGVVRHTPFSKSKLMIAGAVLALLALIPLLFGVVNWATQPAGVEQSVSNEQAAAPEASPSSDAASTPSADAAPAAQAAPAAAAPAAAPAAEVPAAAPPAEAAPAAVPAVVAEPAPAAEAAPAPPGGDPNLYTVASGDTVGSIAARFGVDVNAMLAANGLGAYSVIVPGQVLKLTGPPVAPVAPPAAVQAPVAQAPVAQAQAAAAPAVVAAPAPAPAPAPAVRTIYVAGAGGQSLVDACIGPINYTPTNAYAVFITEHDFCGGWARFSGIGVGETVSIPGYGTFTATGRGQVPNPGTTNDVAAVFGGFPAVVLQTCIPGTNQMLVIALN